MAYVLGVSAFIGSFMIPIMSDPEKQANIVLSIAIIPAAMIGAHFYYRNGERLNGVLLGVFMFFQTIILDALITVPLFIIPAGGNHLEFFTDPGFWMIGLEYVMAVACYRLFQTIKTLRRNSVQLSPE